MSQTKVRNDCLSVILEFCLLLTVVCSASAAYTSLCKGLKCTKNTIFYPKLFSENIRGPIFDFRDSLFKQLENIALCLKIISPT